MTSRWTPLLALATGLGSALLIALLVLGRGTEVFPTYLVYTADPQPLPRARTVELRNGTEVVPRFELLPRGDIAEDVERLDRALSRSNVAGLILDRTTFGDLPRAQLREWRHAGVVLIGHDLDATRIMAELERDELLPPRSGPDVVYLIGPASTTRSVGNPSTIDRDRPFVGVTYLPPRGADAEGDPIGWMAWLQIDDPDLITILARWAVESRHAYAAP